MLENEPTTSSDTNAAASGADAPQAAARRRRPTKKTAAEPAGQTALDTGSADTASSDTASTDAVRSAAPARRRIAKKAAATPPASASDPTPTAADVPASDAEVAAKRPAKRAPRATKAAKAAKVAAAPDTDTDTTEDAPVASDSVANSEPAAGSTRASRSRSRGRGGSNRPPALELSSEDDAEIDPDSTPITGELPAPVVAPSRIPGVLFQAPSEPAAPAAARTRRPRVAVAAEVADVAPENAAAEADEDADETATGESAERESTGPRRRRRGGRGRRTPREDSAAGESTTSSDGDAGSTDDNSSENGPDDEGDDDSHEGSASSRRRRRRRRRGAGSDTETEDRAPDDPPNTVVRVRVPREHEDTDVQGVRGVKGSTRLEAKKQRRREGREQGRGGRRGSVITEAEFLARRESVDRIMVVRQRGDRTQIGVLEDGVLVEHFVSTAATQRMVGNVYLGRVQNVLSGMEAAFVDIGKGRNAVLYAGEVNFDTSGLEGQPRRIESALKPGQPVLVQVTKDSIGHKGARLTSQISLPGRYLVYVPEGSMMGISRKLPDVERGRLKTILKKITPEGAGVIVRTAAEGASEEELTADVARLAAQWEDIKKKSESTTNAPVLLYGEPDLTVRVIRDVFNEDFNALVVQADSEWDIVENYVAQVAPDLVPRLSHWTSEQDIFTQYRLDEQLAKALDRKVWLPSGGYLVIDRTEAMIVVDVNTGRFVGKGGNLEETVTKNNLEAAEEIVRQLRLRDIGGIIVIDFIDMVLESNRDLVLRRLIECLGRDRTKHQVAEVTSLGLVQMTRKRVGNGLLEAFSETCEVCNGRGVIVHTDLVEHKPGRDDEGRDGNGGGSSRGGGGRNQSRGVARPPAIPKPTPPPPRLPGDPVPIPFGELPQLGSQEPENSAETPEPSSEPVVAPSAPVLFAPSANSWTNLADEPVAQADSAPSSSADAPWVDSDDGASVDNAPVEGAYVEGAPVDAAAPAPGSGRSRRGGRRRGGAKVPADAGSSSAPESLNS
jgi:ribonuclease E